MKRSMLALGFAVGAGVAPALAGPDTPPVPPAAASNGVTARITSVRVGDGVIVVINAGTDKGVQRTWHGTVLDGYTDRPFVGGDVVLVRVDKGQTIARVKLTTDQLAKNPRVRLAP